MSTLASMAIPNVSAMAAMPGNVKVACSIDSTATSSNRLKANASDENNPNSR